MDGPVERYTRTSSASNVALGSRTNLKRSHDIALPDRRDAKQQPFVFSANTPAEDDADWLRLEVNGPGKLDKPYFALNSTRYCAYRIGAFAPAFTVNNTRTLTSNVRRRPLFLSLRGAAR